MADIREVVQQMIDAGEPENKIKAVVKAYKEKQASSKEVETQVDAPVTENNTASASDDGSSASQVETSAIEDPAEAQPTALSNLEESFNKARLDESETEDANERGISAVNQYYSDYSTFQKFEADKANRTDVRDKSPILEGGGLDYGLLLEQSNASFSRNYRRKL